MKSRKQGGSSGRQCWVGRWEPGQALRDFGMPYQEMRAFSRVQWEITERFQARRFLGADFGLYLEGEAARTLF